MKLSQNPPQETTLLRPASRGDMGSPAAMASSLVAKGLCHLASRNPAPTHLQSLRCAALLADGSLWLGLRFATPVFARRAGVQAGPEPR